MIVKEVGKSIRRFGITLNEPCKFHWDTIRIRPNNFESSNCGKLHKLSKALPSTPWKGHPSDFKVQHWPWDSNEVVGSLLLTIPSTWHDPRQPKKHNYLLVFHKKQGLDILHLMKLEIKILEEQMERRKNLASSRCESSNWLPIELSSNGVVSLLQNAGKNRIHAGIEVIYIFPCSLGTCIGLPFSYGCCISVHRHCTREGPKIDCAKVLEYDERTTPP